MFSLVGEPVTGGFNPTVFLIVLVQVILDERLDDGGLAAFLASAREDADAHLARVGPN